MKIRNELIRKTALRLGYILSILLVLYLLSVGPIIAICRQFAASPLGPSPAMYYIGLFYTPLFEVPMLVPIVEFYIGLWEKII
ncbi:hypothetical protein Mal35_29610 [Gimesia maris]|uniref:hypothetical protein n=1 Tax=Gimesia maris TaxID=122 RepID=UPI00118A0E0D|nr:hypothetical protein [Gimesia maris]QDT79497.1 hypothetical protein Mal35_29610 [Gimesia maris]